MPSVKINFSDFWKDFDPQDNWFYNFLRNHFDIELSDSPDFLIYSYRGNQHLKFKGIKIFYTGENIRPNFWECDYAISFDFLNNPNHLRLPLYVIWDGLNHLDLVRSNKLSPSDIEHKKKFCSFLVSNGNSKPRVDFFNALSAYKQVDSGGRFMNNLGTFVDDKMSFLRPYKFNIAFENASYPGYVTEKIYQPMFVNTIPIYWGSPQISEEFNPKSFINCHDYSSWDHVIERIIEIDSDDEKYLSMLNEPWLIDNKPNKWMQEERIIQFFSKIFFTQKTPIARTWRKYIGALNRQTKLLTKRISKVK